MEALLTPAAGTIHLRSSIPAVPAAFRPSALSIAACGRLHRAQQSMLLRVSVTSKKLQCRASFSGALAPEVKESVDKLVNSSKVLLFMKGTKLFPQCGFSNTVVQILNHLNVPFETVNILEDETLRQALKVYSSWPTFPQLYVDGEFFGGCDITLEAYQSGELQEAIEKAMCS